MPETVTSVALFANADFIAEDNLARMDETVAEVFARMLGFAVFVTDAPPPAESPERTAIVGFSGAMRGSCEIQMMATATQAAASAMLGGAVVEDDESLDDAIGELCNMIAGGWKNRVSSLSSHCQLSPPTIISGMHYKVQMSRPSVRITRTYCFEQHILKLTLRREDVAPA